MRMLGKVINITTIVCLVWSSWRHWVPNSKKSRKSFQATCSRSTKHRSKNDYPEGDTSCFLDSELFKDSGLVHWSRIYKYIHHINQHRTTKPTYSDSIKITNRRDFSLGQKHIVLMEIEWGFLIRHDLWLLYTNKSALRKFHGWNLCERWWI